MGRQQMRNSKIFAIGCRITILKVYTGKNVIATYRPANGKEQTVDTPYRRHKTCYDKYVTQEWDITFNRFHHDLYVMIQIQNGS